MRGGKQLVLLGVVGNAEIGDATHKVAGAREGEDERALVVHLGGGVGIGTRTGETGIGRRTAERQGVEGLTETAVDKEEGFAVGAHKGEAHFATGGHHIVELVEIALTLEGEFAVLGRSEINGGIGRGEEDIAAAHRVGFEIEGDGVVVTHGVAQPVDGQRKVARPSAMPGRRPRRLTPGASLRAAPRRANSAYGTLTAAPVQVLAEMVRRAGMTRW